MTNLDLQIEDKFSKKELAILKYFIEKATKGKIKELVILYNQRSECLEEIIKYFIECYTQKIGYFAYIKNDEKYFGPDNATKGVRELYFIPQEAEQIHDQPVSEQQRKRGRPKGSKNKIKRSKPEVILTQKEDNSEPEVIPVLKEKSEEMSIPAPKVKQQREKKKPDEEEKPRTFLETVTALGFVVGYSKKLCNENTEYLMIHPSFNTTLYFELDKKGNVDKKYLSANNFPIQIPYSYIINDRKKVILTYRNLDNRTLSVISKKYGECIPTWPLITLGKNPLFISSEDEMIAKSNEMTDKQKMMYFSIMMFKKILALHPELQVIFGEENIALAQEVLNNIDKYDCGPVFLKSQ